MSWNAGAAVWDVAAANPNAEGGGGPVTLPCYAPDSGSPVGDYLGGDMAYFMNAWGNAAPPGEHHRVAFGFRPLRGCVGRGCPSGAALAWLGSLGAAACRGGCAS